MLVYFLNGSKDEMETVFNDFAVFNSNLIGQNVVPMC